MSYILATTDNHVRWYKYQVGGQVPPGEFELVDVLHLHEIPLWSDKESARAAAKALGLKTWRYVKI